MSYWQIRLYHIEFIAMLSEWTIPYNSELEFRGMNLPELFALYKWNDILWDLLFRFHLFFLSFSDYMFEKIIGPLITFIKENWYCLFFEKKKTRKGSNVLTKCDASCDYFPLFPNLHQTPNLLDDHLSTPLSLGPIIWDYYWYIICHIKLKMYNCNFEFL